MEKRTVRTFETRIKIDSVTDTALHDCAHLFAHIKHRLFADIASGKTLVELKNDYVACYEITARHFNALRVHVEGKIASIKKLRPLQIAEAKERISSLTIKIKKLSKTKVAPQIIHQKKRRLNRLKQKLEQLKEDHEKGTIRCCFGSKKLFRAQFDLEKNGYASHEEWLKEWQQTRAKEIFFLGSKDETAGNQTCTAMLQPDGTLQLRIRLPDALFEKHGKYLLISGVNFNYGRQEILTLLSNHKQISQAISWRLVHDKKGWRLFATLDVQPIACTSNRDTGVIGLDINANHFALVETDRSGNPISKKVIPLNLYGKSFDQTRAVIGDATASVIAYADSTHKPLVFEDLNFQRKKTELREKNRGSYARMLSSFAYGSIITHLRSRAAKKGVFIQEVNPAYTSLIGRVKFARRYSLSIHQAAALTIGRRYLRCSEKVPLALSKIPDGKDGHVTLSLPERNRGKHVWSLWRQVSKKLQTALAAHFRTAESRSRSSLEPAPETEALSKVVGVIPTREPSEALLA
jgi:IS605 OrfB family transposase